MIQAAAAINSFASKAEQTDFARPYSEEIQALRDEIANLKVEIDFLHERLGRELLEDRQRISHLENRKSPSNNDRKLVDELYDEMILRDRVQTTFRGVASILEVGKRRALQLKDAIALDARFILLPSDSHSQRIIVALREQYIKK